MKKMSLITDRINEQLNYLGFSRADMCRFTVEGADGTHVTLGSIILTKIAEDKRSIHFQVKDGGLNWKLCTSAPK